MVGMLASFPTNQIQQEFPRPTLIWIGFYTWMYHVHVHFFHTLYQPLFHFFPCGFVLPLPQEWKHDQRVVQESDQDAAPSIWTIDQGSTYWWLCLNQGSIQLLENNNICRICYAESFPCCRMLWMFFPKSRPGPKKLWHWSHAPRASPFQRAKRLQNQRPKVWPLRPSLHHQNRRGRPKHHVKYKQRRKSRCFSSRCF